LTDRRAERIDNDMESNMRRRHTPNQITVETALRTGRVAYMALRRKLESNKSSGPSSPSGRA